MRSNYGQMDGRTDKSIDAGQTTFWREFGMDGWTDRQMNLTDSRLLSCVYATKITLLSTEVDRVRGGKSGHGARAGRDTETESLSRLEPGVLIHLLSSDPQQLMVRGGRQTVLCIACFGYYCY